MVYYMLTCEEPDDWEDSALLNHIPGPNGESWRDQESFTYKVEEPPTLGSDHVK